MSKLSFLDVCMSPDYASELCNFAPVISLKNSIVSSFTPCAFSRIERLINSNSDLGPDPACFFNTNLCNSPLGKMIWMFITNNKVSHHTGRNLSHCVKCVQIRTRYNSVFGLISRSVNHRRLFVLKLHLQIKLYYFGLGTHFSCDLNVVFRKFAWLKLHLAFLKEG